MATKPKKSTYDVVVNIVLQTLIEKEGKKEEQFTRLAHFPLKRRGVDTDDALAWYLQNVQFEDDLDMSNNVTLVARHQVDEDTSISTFIAAVDFGYCPACGSVAGTPSPWCPVCSNVQAPDAEFSGKKRLLALRGIEVDEDDEEEEIEEAPKTGRRGRTVTVEAK